MYKESSKYCLDGGGNSRGKTLKDAFLNQNATFQNQRLNHISFILGPVC
jgi:hypothetical protein